MNVTELIIQTALLGTASREFAPGSFPESLQTLVERIREKSEDTEAFLYMTAASAFTYRRAGWEPAGAEGIVPVEPAPEEDLPYFDRDRSQLFSRLHGTRYMLAYAYHMALGSGKIISPEYLQPLIRRAYDCNNPLRFEERRLLKGLVGNRGLWLIRQMGLAGDETDKTDSWDTAIHSERKEMLARFRQQDPAAALELLRKDWKSEPANQRNELLEGLRTNISKADEPFIQWVLESDRSTTVRETARKLLCMIPDSAMVKRCCELLRGHIRHNMLTGWSYDEIGYTEEMKAMGLSEVSSNKKESDSEFILRQLAERVPLSFWCEVYCCGKEEAARKFAKHPPFRKFMELEDPILNFSDGLWAFHTLKEDPSYMRKPELVAMLTTSQREEISWPETVRNFGFIPDSWYGNDYEAWGPKFSSNVLSWILEHEYVYYAADMAERLAMHIPSHLRNLIEVKAASSVEVSPSMNEFCSKMLEFMDLKSETDTLLNEK
ncbi:MAG: DUF5691 domain-containing protein [Parabacteroides sp.]|nr:DUF5691 domain-containing protein [Parabacteroides sp.]